MFIRIQRTLFIVLGTLFACSVPTSAQTTITIHAAGSTGEEIMELKLHGRTVRTWNRVGGDPQTEDFCQFSYEATYDVLPWEVAVAFLNDDGPRNIRVEKVSFYYHNSRFEQEIYMDSPDTYSTGTYDDETRLAPGYKESEWLHGTGEFRLDYRYAEQTPRMRVLAAGVTGEETIEILHNDVTVARFENVGGNADRRRFETLEYLIVPDNHGRIPPITQFRVAFVNDGYTRSGQDRNVRVDGIVIADDEDDYGYKYESEDPNTLSTGTWDPINGQSMGHKESEWLACNGYFEYFGYHHLDRDDKVLEIRIAGETGRENISILDVLDPAHPDYRVKFYFFLGGNAELDEFITLRHVIRDGEDGYDDIFSRRVFFENDGYTWDGRDKNVRFDWFRLMDSNGRCLKLVQAEADNVYSTGTWKEEDGCAPGFRNSEWLTCYGYFQIFPEE